MSEHENRTEAPSIKRIARAHAEGKFPAIGTAAGTLFFFTALLVMELAAAGAIGRFLVWTRELRQAPFDVEPLAIRNAAMRGLSPFVLLLLLLLLTGLVVPTLTASLSRGWVFLPNKVAPDFSRLIPKFTSFLSIGTLWNLGLAAFQITGALLIVFLYLRSGDRGDSLLTLPPSEWPGLLRTVLLPLTLRLGLFSLIPATADLFFQRWKFHRDLRMTPEEVKREQKEEARKSPRS
jgi:flagellar biosynthetic protein FlhB